MHQRSSQCSPQGGNSRINATLNTVIRSRKRTQRLEVAGRDLDRKLRALIEEHAASAYSLAFGILQDRGLAEDVVQETMIRAWQNRTQFRGEASVKTWILRIARNAAIDQLRRQRDQAMDPQEFTATPETKNSRFDPESAVEELDVTTSLRHALDQLDDLTRSMIILREIEGLSYKDIAEALNVSLPNVKTRISRGRQQLQDVLNAQGGQRHDRP